MPIGDTGSLDSPYLIIAEAPTPQDVANGRLLGRTGSGRIFWAAASTAGLDRSECYVTSVIQSEPGGQSGRPLRKQVLAEWERLDAVLQASQAQVVIPLGSIALERLTGISRGILRMAGYCIRRDDCSKVLRRQRVQIGSYKANGKRCPACREIPLKQADVECSVCGGRRYDRLIGDPRFAMRNVAVDPVLPPRFQWIIPTLDPETVRRSGFRYSPMLRTDLDRAVRARYGKLRPMDRPPFGVAAVAPGPRVPLVTLDIETPMPPNDWVIERVSMAWTEDGEDRVWTAPWGDAGVQRVVRDVMANSAITKSFHNGAAFDMPRLERAGCPLRGDYLDTMYAAQCVESQLPKGLEKCATRYLDLTPWKHRDTNDELYSAKDSWVQHALAPRLWHHLVKTEQELVFQDMMAGLRPLVQASLHGIELDTPVRDAWVEDLSHKLREYQGQWNDLLPAVNPESNQQVAELLFRRWRLPRQRNAEGGETVKRSALFACMQSPRCTPERKELIKLLINIRRTAKDLKTYARVNTPDGRVHPQFLPGDGEESGGFQGATTGRIQARKPNIMNQNSAARRMYIPSAPDKCLLYIDWSSAEARVEAWLSRDWKLLEAIESDLHANNSRIMGCDRTRAKNIYYGTGRGAGPRKLTRTFHEQGTALWVAGDLEAAERMLAVTERDMREAQNRLFAEYGLWSAWRRGLVALGESQGWIAEPFGRRLNLYGPGPHATRIIGHVPQATVASMLWRILPQVASVADVQLLSPQHDAVLVEVPAAYARDRAEAIVSIMEQEFPEVAAGFSCPADAAIGLPGESWGAMEERLDG